MMGIRNFYARAFPHKKACPSGRVFRRLMNANPVFRVLWALASFLFVAAVMVIFMAVILGISSLLGWISVLVLSNIEEENL